MSATSMLSIFAAFFVQSGWSQSTNTASSTTGFAVSTKATATTAATSTSTATSTSDSSSTSSTSSTSPSTLIILLIGIPALVIVSGAIKKFFKHRAAVRASKEAKASQLPAVYYLQAAPPPFDPRYMQAQWGTQQPLSSNSSWVESEKEMAPMVQAQPQQAQPHHALQPPLQQSPLGPSWTPASSQPIMHTATRQSEVKKARKWFG